MNFSSQLKKYRLINGYTVENLAEACGVTHEAAEAWENGKAEPDVHMLLRLSGLFHVSMEMLLTGRDASGIEDPRSQADVRAENEKLINKGLRQAMRNEDPNDEIQVFIGYIGRMMNCDRSYIFEQDPRGDYCNTYEWCNDGVKSGIDTLQCISSDDLKVWLDTFREGEYVFIENLEKIKTSDPVLYDWLYPKNISSVIVFPLFGGRAFFGVDNPALAFTRKAATLLELTVHFVESMLQHRDLMHRLLIETDQTHGQDMTAHRARYYINIKTGGIVMNTDAFRNLGYEIDVHSVADLNKLLSRHPECRSHIMEDGFKTVRDTHKATTIEFVFYTNNHLIRWMRLSICPFLDSRGNLLQLHGSLQDISDEHEIIDRYNVFTSHLHGGMHICYLSDPCHLYYASDNLCELVGYTRQDFDEIVGDSYDSLIVDEDLPAFKGFVRRLTENPGTEETCEYRLKRRDGSIVRVIDTMESKMDGNGIVYGYANVMDVSELHRTLDIAEKNELTKMAELDRQFQIVDALSRDFYNIFLIDPETGQAFIHKLNGYVAGGMDRRSTGSISYYDYCRQYIRERVYPADWEKMFRALHLDTVLKELQEGKDYVSYYRILDEGEVRYCEFKFILTDENERGSQHPTQVIAAFRSIDEMVRRDMEQKKDMHLRQNIINAFLELYVVVYYVDLEENTVRELTLGHDSIREPQNAVTFVRSNSTRFGYAREQMEKMLSPEAVKERLSDRGYVCEQCRNGEDVWYEISLIAGSRDSEGQVKQFFIMIRDISDEKIVQLKQADELRRSHRRELEMQKTAYMDALTGVMNRTAYQSACRKHEKDSQLCIVYCDVNGLKFNNDTYGHSAGDRLLCRFAEVLKHHFPADCIFRVGGDEFICMFSGIDREKFEKRVEELTAEINREGGIAAVGYAHGSGSNTEALLEEAEKMMYDRKAQQKLEREKTGYMS